MKARNKKTGEVVTSFSLSKEWGTASYIDNANTLRICTPLDGDWEMIDESEPVDWSAFRREAAKDILAGAIASVKVYAGTDKAGIVKFALDYTDELIKQLKEGEA